MKVLSFSPVVLYDNVKGINEITISNRIALLKRQTRGLKLLLRRVARKSFKKLKTHEFTEKFPSL